jgi:alpha-amylase
MGLEKLLHYDIGRRLSLVDHFWAEKTTLDAVFENRDVEVGDFAHQPYAVDVSRESVSLERLGTVKTAQGTTPLRVQKTLKVDTDAARTEITYTLTNPGNQPLSLWFAPEFNVNLLAPDAEDRYYYLPEASGSAKTGTKASGGGAATALADAVATRPAKDARLKDTRMVSRGELKAIKALGLRDEWMGIDYALHFDRPADVWRFPVETVSQSEAGFEKIYQSSALYPNWQVSLGAGESWQVVITQTLQALS